jgi:hypothetical protein
MNKSIPFGYHSLAGNTLIKLNMHLTDDDADEIREIFDFYITHNSMIGPMGYRIEGVLSHSTTLAAEWFRRIEIYKLNAKLEKLANKRAEALDRALSAQNLLINLNDLPF